MDPNLVEWKIKEYVNVSFEPKEDITAFELASLMPYFHGKNMTTDDWDALGAMKRHLKRHNV